MNHLYLLAGIGSQLLTSAQETGQQFGWEKARFISQCISFLLVSGALWRWAYKPILTILEERRRRIADGLANADKIKAELARTEANRLEVLNQANIQANKIIEEARNAAAKVTEQETQKAVASAQDIINKAHQASETELARMKTELRREVGRLVVETTAKATGKILTPDDQRRIAEETSRQLAA